MEKQIDANKLTYIKIQFNQTQQQQQQQWQQQKKYYQ